MNMSRIASVLTIALIGTGIAGTALHAGTGVGGAPAPLAGAGLLYLAATGAAGGVWFAIRKLGAHMHNRKPDDQS